jgi:peptidase C39-like protein
MQQQQRSVERRSYVTIWSSLFFVVLMVLLPGGFSVVNAATTPAQFNAFWQQDNAAAFSHWTLNGITLNASTSNLQLTPGKTALTCSATDIDGGKASYSTSTGLCSGRDPLAAGSYNNGQSYYNGGSFYFGTATSPIVAPTHPINSIVVSWKAATPAGTWLEIHIRTQQGGSWTHWYKLPVWASTFDPVQRHSIDGQADAGGSIDTDTYTTGAQNATAYQVALTLFTTTPSTSPTLRRVAAIASYNNAQNMQKVTPDKSVWGKNLAVPQRSQMLPEYQGQGYGGGGEVWCSPTSTSMVMAYWSNVLKQPVLNQTVPHAARGTYDFTYQGTGNWPFNTAYAGSYGLHAFVTRMYSLSQIEQWIKVGVPIVISIAYGNGQLPGSPIPSSTGHLLVVRGFAANGDVIANDPAAASDAQVQITYPRAIFESLWQRASNGATYVIYPEGWRTPTTNALGSW